MKISVGRAPQSRTTVSDHTRRLAMGWLLEPERWWRRISPWGWLMAALIAAYVVYFSVRTVSAHFGLGTSAFDFALYDQGVWLLSRFKNPFVTLMGRHLFGDHASLILILVTPLFWFIENSGLLLVVQSLVIGLAAIPVYLYARERIGDPAFAVLLGAAFLLHPAVAWTNLENYHPDSFLALFVGFAMYAALTSRWRLYAIAVVLALLVKEDVALVMIPLGIWVALKRDRRVGLFTVGGSVLYALFALFVVMRPLIGVPTLNLWRIPFGGPLGLIREALIQPGNVIDHLMTGERPWYLWQMLAPTGFVFLRRPGLALVSGLVLLANMVSTFGYQHEIQYHYSLVAVPALIFGSAWAIGSASRKVRNWMMVVLTVMTVWTSFLWGPMPWARDVRGVWAPSHPVAVAASEIIAEIPEDAVVSAHHRLTAHLARREEIYMFPNPFSISLYGTDRSRRGERLPAAEEVEYVLLPNDLTTLEEHQEVWLREQDAFELAESNDHWSLYRRK
jgi:uncharacterized membrane protein